MNSLESANTEVLTRIEREAHKDNVPIIRKEMESFLRRFAVFLATHLLQPRIVYSDFFLSSLFSSGPSLIISYKRLC